MQSIRRLALAALFWGTALPLRAQSSPPLRVISFREKLVLQIGNQRLVVKPSMAGFSIPQNQEVTVLSGEALLLVDKTYVSVAPNDSFTYIAMAGQPRLLFHAGAVKVTADGRTRSYAGGEVAAIGDPSAPLVETPVPTPVEAEMPSPTQPPAETLPQRPIPPPGPSASESPSRTPAAAGQQPPDKNAAPATIGEKPADNRELFIRESTVLLKPKEMEMEIGLNYSRSETRGVLWDPASLIAAILLGDLSLAQSSQQSRIDRRLFLPLSFRGGLFHRVEGFATVSPGYEDVDAFLGTKRTDKIRRPGIADINVGAKFLLARETDATPDVVLSLGGGIPTKDNPYESGNRAHLSSGHFSGTGDLTLVKAFDPVVLYGGAGYTRFAPRHGLGSKFAPGEILTYKFGLGFAVNTKITLSGQFVGAYQGETRVNDVLVAGSSTEPLSLRLGVSLGLTKTSYCDAGVTMGLNQDAPGATLSLSYAFRF